MEISNKRHRRLKSGLLAKTVALRSDTDSAISSLNGKLTTNNPISPYLSNDKIQMLSRVTERKFIHKKTTDFVSSFPLAVKLYKASSDQLKTVKTKKKTRKSVHTLPNDPAPLPQLCTVSDMNDSEYCEKSGIIIPKPRVKKRNLPKNSKKARVREKRLAYFDREDLYCSPIDMGLDESTTNMLKHYNGDKHGRKSYNTMKLQSTVKPQDVWAALRNMNRFEFVQSPPISVGDLVSARKKHLKRCPNRKDKRFIECCTEEFAYISSYEVENHSNTLSQSSSCDRVTVIDNDVDISTTPKLNNSISNTNDKCIVNSSYNNISENKPKGKNVPEFFESVECKGIGTRLHLKGPNIRLKKPPSCCSTDTGFLSDAENGHTTDNSEAFTPMNIGSVPKNNNKSLKRSTKLQNKITHTEPIKAEPNRNSGNTIKPKLKDVNKLTKPNLISENINEDSLKSATKTVPDVVPKLTKTEIKKALARYKFPIVFSDKDTPGIQVFNYDQPQFDGLDHHVWPFMVKWSDNKKYIGTLKASTRNTINNKKAVTKISNNNSGPQLAKTQSNVPEIITGKQIHNEEGKYLINNVISSYKKNESKQDTVVRRTPLKKQQSHKPKPIVQDDNINLLYKKASFRNFDPDPQETIASKEIKCAEKISTPFGRLQLEGKDTYKKDSNNIKYTEELTSRQNADITTRIQLGLMALNNALKQRAVPEEAPALKQNVYRKPPPRIRPWEKPKLTNDFIDNIFKKIKNGVYYTQDITEDLGHKRSYLREIGTQAESTSVTIDATSDHSFDSFSFKGKKTEIKVVSSIPGFNDSLPALEIENFDKNQITLKNCITNIMVQFDIAIPVNSNKYRANKLPSLVPVENTGSNTQIYKCKTIIENAMLPAEICSILPKIMNNVSGFNVAGETIRRNIILSTITENCSTESTLANNHYLARYVRPSIKIICKGTFPPLLHSLCTRRSILDVNCPFKYSPRAVKNLWDMERPLPRFAQASSLILELYPHYEEKTETSLTPLVSMECNIIPCCTTLDVYSTKNNRIAPPFKRYDIVSTILSAARCKNLKIDFQFSSYVDMSNLQPMMNLNVTVTNDKGTDKIIMTVKKLNVQSIFKSQCTSEKEEEKSCIKSIESDRNTQPHNVKRCETPKSKIKRKVYNKLYRKCNSTSNIQFHDKLNSTPLSKVSTLEDFFQIFGSNKMLTSVFDASASEKILKCVMEMKSWITEINAQQAILVLLLTNKKDTPSLVRFRPILLQAIAVNRITRANELDMEIEVIEREQFNKFSQYQGIYYSPESVENYNNLFEELCWIAKTTASDYQKPFDESSEKLLKSLLEKRKKLNPSYLRVMARYVGLGLLKSPNKR